MTQRRYTTDYAGAWRGHCCTRESAILAAVKRLVMGEYSRATITDKDTNQDIARITLADNRKSAVITTVTQLKKAKP